MSGGVSPLVLHVDDNEMHRYVVDRILRKSGFSVVQAATGTEGMNLLQQISPDLIILDVRLPDANGMDLCRQIKDSPATAHIPVLQLSAHFTGAEHKIEGLESGADAYLSSGVDPRELVATVKALLRMRTAEEQARAAAEDWQATFDTVRDAVLILDSEARLVRCNQAVLAMLGKTDCGEVNGRRMNELLPELDLTRQLSAAGEEFPAGTAKRDNAPQEFEHNGRWFRAALDRISSGIDRDGRFVCVIADVTQEKRAAAEIRRINDDLIAARDSALDASRAKSAFLANMSHELRTPLNIIIGYTEMLHEDAQEQDLHSYVKDLERIRETGRHLVELVSNILDLSKIEAGRVDVHLHSIDIAAMVHEIADTVKPLVEKRQNTLVLDLEYGLGSMWTDSVKLRQILLNLLSNACKFTEHGQIVVSANRRIRQLRDWVVFRVADTGEGIEAEHLPKLFREYSQLGEATPGLKGTGLGLAISQRLCEMIGGVIEVESNPGRGTVFTVTVPAKLEDRERPVVSSTPHPAGTAEG